MLYIIQNDPEVPPGLVAEELNRLGARFVVVHPYRGEALPELSAVSAIIVMGGAMGANDDRLHPFLTPLKAFIADAARQGIPYLGICLGGQLLAAALGAKVISNRWEELGTLSVSLTGEGLRDRLFNGIDRRFVTFQWHHDSFDPPPGAHLLAFSQACPHQAFRIGENAWGLQFHPEVNETIIRDWSSWSKETAAQTEELLAEYRSHENEYREVSSRIMENFLMVEIPKT